MRINNKTKIALIRRIFFLTGVFFAIAAFLLFFFDMMGLALVSIGVFSLWYLYFYVADYQFIEFRNENSLIILRYYKAISIGSPKFSEIEFPQNILKNVFFDNSIFGKMSDVTLVVKTKRGVAEYPSVSLSAVSKDDRQKIADSLNDVLSHLN